MRPFKKYVTCIMAFLTLFNFVTLYQFYSTTSPVSFSKLHQETIEWKGKRFFAYMTASAYITAFLHLIYHVISKKSHILNYYMFLQKFLLKT